MSRRLSGLLPLIGVVLLVVFSSGIVSAAVTTSSETTYNGSHPDADQAIEVTYTVSPEGGTINNMTVDFDSTGQTFIQANSFSFTVSPGGADIDVQSRSGNRFFVQEIEPNEEVTFVFTVYPKTIKQQQIDAVSVRIGYIQNGQDLSTSETVTANMSSSPWFKLQAAEETIDRLRSQLEQVTLVGQITDVAFLGGLLVGVVGIVFGAYSWRRRNREREELKREHAANLESLAERMEKTSDGKRLNNEAEAIREELEETGTGGGGGDDW